MALGSLILKFRAVGLPWLSVAVQQREELARARVFLEKFERMRAAAGLRPSSIHVDASELVRLAELPADALVLAAANDD